MGYHAVFSITVPVLITELIYPHLREEAWLGKWGWVAMALLFVLNGLGLAIFLIGAFGAGHANPAPQVMIAAAAIVAVTIAAALRARPRAPAKGVPRRAAPRPKWVRMVAFLGGLGWFAVRMFLTDQHLPVFVPLLADAVVAASLAMLIGRWSAADREWTREHTYALATGPLPVSWLFGFIIVAVTTLCP